MKYSLKDLTKGNKSDLIILGIIFIICLIISIVVKDIRVVIGGFLVCSFILFSLISGNIQLENVIKAMDEEEKNLLSQELANTHLTNGCWYLTGNFIIIVDDKITMIKYKDIILMDYKLKVEGNTHLYLKQRLTIFLRNGLKYSFVVDFDNDKALIACSNIILSKNKNVLEGKSKENIKIVKEKYKLDL